MKYLTPEELAEMLGVSKLTIYGWTSRRAIPFYRIGRLVRFRQEDVDSWIQENKIEPRKI